MTQNRFYLDTSIWMDYYEDRKDPNKHLGELAFRLLCKLLASKSAIVVSQIIFLEMATYYSMDEIRGITMPFERLIIKANISKAQKEEAITLAKERKVPRGDALHAILARDNQAILVSRDRHFQLLKDICSVMKPEELI
jgi:predicted nucleic acid-binding protein